MLPTGCRYQSRRSMIPPELTRLTDLGWHIFPVSRQTKKTPFKGAKDAATTDRDIIADWIREYPDCNWRAHPGKSGILCLDIDRAGNLHECDGFATMRALEQKYGKLPDGPRLKTGGSGGCVAFFRHDGRELRGGPSALGKGIDVSTVRGAACPTLPPSIHQVSGGKYLWYRGHAPWEIELPPIPDWICEKLKPLPIPEFKPVDITDEYAAKMMGYYASDVRNAPSGMSNRVLYISALKAGKLVAVGKISRSEAFSALQGAANERIKGDDRASIAPVIKRGLDDGRRCV